MQGEEDDQGRQRSGNARQGRREAQSGNRRLPELRHQDV